jgi:hypothetical protein
MANFSARNNLILNLVPTMLFTACRKNVREEYGKQWKYRPNVFKRFSSIVELQML